MTKRQDRTIETFDGTKALRSECRYISGKFYKMGAQCFHMDDGKWHRINNGLIDFDHETQHWILKSNADLYSGIIGFDEDKPIIGKFSLNNLKNVEVIKNYMETAYLCISDDIIPTEYYVEELSTGRFIHKSQITGSKKYLRKRIGVKYPFRLNYSFEHQYLTFKNYYDKFFSYKRSNNKSFFKELGNTTYGFEIETFNGIIPIRHCYKAGLIPLRDGSLRHSGIQPFEYTSIPLNGEKGLHTIRQSCELLNKYCVKNIDGSTHIHLGNFPRTKEYAVGLFKLLQSIQDEVYSLFPKYFNKTSLFKMSGKDYCKPLPKISFIGDPIEDCNKLFRYFINGRSDWNDYDPHDIMDWGVPESIADGEEDFYMGIPHPQDSGFDHKWYQSYR